MLCHGMRWESHFASLSLLLGWRQSDSEEDTSSAAWQNSKLHVVCKDSSSYSARSSSLSLSIGALVLGIKLFASGRGI